MGRLIYQKQKGGKRKKMGKKGYKLLVSCLFPLFLFWNHCLAFKKIKVGLVFDVGGKGDKSFNDAAYQGLELAKKELGISFEYIEPLGTGEDRESALRKFASRKDIDLIFGVGHIFTDDITRIAKLFPNKKFACVDYTVTDPAAIPKNLVALKFKEEEGSFLVGAIAGLLTKTNKVGFIGGMKNPLIEKFEAGFRAGVKYVNPKCEISSAYAGFTGEAYRNPTKGKELALSMYDSGVDIIYHASGLTGLGVFEAAKLKNKLAIGVDSDQYHVMPGHVLTSMLKRVDIAVFETIKTTCEGKFTGGVRVFDLKSRGVDYVYDENNKNLIPEDVYQKVETIRKKILQGEIKIPTKVQEIK